MQLTFIKCHGSGNDFLLLDEYTKPNSLTDDERTRLAITLCNRENAIGADGILFFQKSEIADGRMRVFNADGSEASMCGNGLRCVVRYASELLSLREMKIETMKAVLHCEKTVEIHSNIPTYKVEISPVSFDVKDLPLNIEEETFINKKLEDLTDSLSFTAVAVPNPHFISIVSKDVLKTNTQEQIATFLNGENPYFPDGVNVSFVHILEKGSIFVKTFERGVGFTNACGTAMSASSLVTCIQQFNAFDEEITVYNPGGKVKCVAGRMGQSYSIHLIGNATFERKMNVEVFVSEFEILSTKEYPEEIHAYELLKEDVQKYLATRM